MVCEESSSTIQLLNTATADSSSFAESSFRELDDAFLQTQTRIWLGEVLQIRLDDQILTSELLADGELLFQVSKVMWKLLLEKHMELRNIKTYKNHPFSSKRNSGMYRPYSNVDSFLKICKILGLTGIDLFTPSDVVERKNTRKVCMCIRSFSKKARSMSINVPDFDIVTCMVAMPKDMVGCIRRSIELSHVDSSSQHLQKLERRKSSQGYSVTSSNRDYMTCSDPANDTEILLQFPELHADDLNDYKSEISYNIPSVMGESDFVSEDLDQLDAQNQPRNEISNDECELLSPTESLEYHYSDNIENEHDCKLAWLSTSRGDHFDTSVEQVQESRIIDYDYFEHALFRNNASVTGTPTNDRTSAIDATLFAKDKKDSDMIGEINSTPNVHQSVSSYGLDTTPHSVEIGRCYDNSDNMEVLQVAGVNSLAREPLNLGDLFDADNNDQIIESFESYNDKNGHWDKIKEYEAQDIMKFKELAYEIASNARNSYSVNKFEEIEHSLYSPDCYSCNTNTSDRLELHNNDISSSLLKKYLVDEVMESPIDSRCLDNASCDQYEELLSSHSYDLPEFCKWDQKGKSPTTSNRVKEDSQSSTYFSENVPHNETAAPNKQKDSEVMMSNILLSCIPSKEGIVSAATIKLDSDSTLNNGCLNLASKSLGVVDKYEKSPTQDDETNDSDIGNGGQRMQHMVTNDVVAPTKCDVDDQSSKLEYNEAHQTSQYDTNHIYHPEHSLVHIKEELKPEDETEDGGIEIPKSKSQKKLLLRSVLGGATAVGLLFMFLNLRKNVGEKAVQPSKTSSHKNKENIQKNSTKKVNMISTTKEVYPAEKLQLK
ncbi:uncharacterized protein LOC131602925 isoform X2 [Vicia villosa]|uniref:uncharacterized protein LOC131602925 isoform X2 n=1 Tax=Vicia villosa TaxID=3911 RepID=UPI00273AE5DD|nr:uncharacterized protein LOC131602925 isoform X2 [Vicia villosa]